MAAEIVKRINWVLEEIYAPANYLAIATRIFTVG